MQFILKYINILFLQINAWTLIILRVQDQIGLYIALELNKTGVT